MPKETSVEKRLVKKAREAGGDCIKLIPVIAGTPDRLVFLPHNRIFLVETKTDGGHVRPIQQVWHDKAARYGVPVYLLWNSKMVDAWVEAQMQEIDRFDRLVQIIKDTNVLLDDQTLRSLLEQAERLA